MVNRHKVSTIVLATRNRYKIKEIETILGSDIEYQTISKFLNVEIKEVGRSLLENSYAKAVFSFKISGKPSLADDSGLFVESLDGEPGVYSSRYGSNDKERISKLLKNLAIKIIVGQNSRRYLSTIMRQVHMKYLKANVKVQLP